MSTSITPFKREHYDRLKAMQRDLHDLLPLMDKAKACGIDCDQLCQMRTLIAESLEKIEHNFMTPPPSN